MKKKRPLLQEVFLGFLNRVFPCYHPLRKTAPSHSFKISYRFLFCGMGEWNVTKLSYVTLTYFKIFAIKKQPNLEKRT